MKRPLSFLIPCLLTFLSCHSGRPKDHRLAKAGPDTPVGDQSAGILSGDTSNTSSGNDTSTIRVDDDIPRGRSMVALKWFKKISVEKAICQRWQFENSDEKHWNTIFWDSVADKRRFPEVNLFSDHTFTENTRCDRLYRMGAWKLNKKTRELYLSYGGNRSRTYIIGDLALKRLEFYLVGANNDLQSDVADITCTADAKVHADIRSDPFYPGNNQWRIKPKKKETDTQLRLRVRQFVHFFALFFWDNYASKSTEISWSGLPSCFEWYNGGISMQERADLDRRWKDCFYSEDQAYTAYDILGDILQSHVLKWPDNPTSWVKQTAQVLDQMEKKL